MSEQIPNNQVTLRDAFLTIKEWVAYLFSKWLIISLFGIAGGILGLIYSFNQKPVYTATLTFALEDQPRGGALSGALGFASQFGLDLGVSGGGMFESANLIELFKSRTIIEETLLLPFNLPGQNTTFAEKYLENEGWREELVKKPALSNIHFLPKASRLQFTRAQDSILGAIYLTLLKTSLTVVQKDRKVDIITIETKSSNEDFAKNFTEALAREVSDFYVTTKSKKAQINMAILQRQTDSIRAVLNGAITDVAVANDNTFALNPALNIQRTPSTRRQIDVQYNIAILTELVKQTELARVTLRKETPLLQLIDRPILPLKKEKLGKLKALIIGGILAGMLIVTILVIRRLFKQVILNEKT